MATVIVVGIGGPAAASPLSLSEVTTDVVNPTASPTADAPVSAEPSDLVSDAIAPATEAVATVTESAAVTEQATQLVDVEPPTVAPVAEAVETVVEAVEPVVAAAAPLVAPVVETVEPVVAAAAPVVAPVVETVEPVVAAAAPVVETVAPVVEAAASPVTSSPAPTDSVSPTLASVTGEVQRIVVPVTNTTDPLVALLTDGAAAAPIIHTPTLDVVSQLEATINSTVSPSTTSAFVTIPWSSAGAPLLTTAITTGTATGSEPRVAPTGTRSPIANNAGSSTFVGLTGSWSTAASPRTGNATLGSFGSAREFAIRPRVASLAAARQPIDGHRTQQESFWGWFGTFFAFTGIEPLRLVVPASAALLGGGALVRAGRRRRRCR